MKVFVQKIGLFLVLMVGAGSILAQQFEKSKGVELYEKGDYPAAVNALKNVDESRELYYLALSYEKIKEPGKAKETLIKCLVKSYDVYTRRFYDWQKVNAQKANKPLSEFLLEIRSNSEIGFLAAKKAVELDPNIFKGKDLAFKAETLRKIISIGQTADIIYSNTNKSVSPVKITQKPRADFPKDLSGAPLSRRSQSLNKPITVVVLTVFGADGEIKLLIPVDPVIDAYTVECLKAAAKIKFNPAAVNDKPVFSYNVIEYSFTIE